MRKVLGYAVSGVTGPVGLGFGDNSQVLWRNHFTIFSTRVQAIRAIQRTKQFCADHGYDWDVEKLHIRVVDRWL